MALHKFAAGKKNLLEGKGKKSFPTHQEIYRAPNDEEDGKLAGTSDIPWERVARCTESHGTQQVSCCSAHRECSVNVGNRIEWTNSFSGLPWSHTFLFSYTPPSAHRAPGSEDPSCSYRANAVLGSMRSHFLLCQVHPRGLTFSVPPPPPCPYLSFSSPWRFTASACLHPRLCQRF